MPTGSVGSQKREPQVREVHLFTLVMVAIISGECIAKMTGFTLLVHSLSIDHKVDCRGGFGVHSGSMTWTTT